MFFWSNYQAWLEVADTALPRNLFGYILVCCLGPFRVDPFDTNGYSDPKEIAKCGVGDNAVGQRSFLRIKLPTRDGPRPKILKFIAPHRQSTQLTGPDMHILLAQAIDALVAEHAAHVVVRTSVLEKSGDALLIADNIATPHEIAKKTKREIAHVHSGPERGDFSIHICLSPPDCKEIIEKGWGERMGLAGRLMPLEYLIIYTPRTQGEVEIVKAIVNAGIEFMTGGRNSVE